MFHDTDLVSILISRSTTCVGRMLGKRMAPSLDVKWSRLVAWLKAEKSGLLVSTRVERHTWHVSIGRKATTLKHMSGAGRGSLVASDILTVVDEDSLIQFGTQRHSYSWSHRLLDPSP